MASGLVSALYLAAALLLAILVYSILQQNADNADTSSVLRFPISVETPAIA